MLQKKNTQPTTYLVHNHTLQQGGYCILNEHPCLILDISHTKDCSHGHGKTYLKCRDLITNEYIKREHGRYMTIEVPYVTLKEYSLLGIQGDGYLILMNDDYSTKEDIQLFETNQEHQQIAKSIKTLIDEGKEINVTVVTALGYEYVINYREIQD